jgi:hypothetical protein
VESFVQCPKCGERIAVAEALSKQVEETLRSEYELRSAEERQRQKQEYEEVLAAERDRIAAEAALQASGAVGIELEDLRAALEEASHRLEAAGARELELRKERRGLLDREANLELEISQKLDEERKKIEERVTERLGESHRLEKLQDDQKLRELTGKIEELERKAKQGSQQTQGEAIEVELEDLLQATFPHDQITPVGKGIRGADVVQRIYVQAGQCCGTIVWESKNTKNWSDAWPDKLKEDLRVVKGDCAVLVSVALPPGVMSFEYREGVWVTSRACAMALASVLRAGIIEVATARAAATGLSQKMGLVYEYLSGVEFRQRVQAIVEAFVAMSDDLQREKRAMETQWARREKLMDRVLRNVSGLYGDVRGMIVTLPQVEILELALPAEATNPEDLQPE